MKKSIKRALAIILSVVMLVSAVPFTASANTATSTKKPVYVDDMGASYAQNGFTGAYGYAGYASDAYTIEYLYNPGATIGDNAAINIGERNTTAGEKNYFEIQENGKFHFVYSANGVEHSVYDMWGGNDFFGGTALNKNTWYLIDVVITNNDGKDVVKTYVNGAEKGNFTFDFSNKNYTLCKYLASAHSVQFGMSCGHWGNDTDGYVDNFYVYNYAKTATQINTAYKATGNFLDNLTPGYAENLLYCSNNVVWKGDGNNETLDAENQEYKIAVPETIVAIYDGSSEAYFPIKLETVFKNDGTRYFNYAQSNDSNYAIKSNWRLVDESVNGSWSYNQWTPEITSSWISEVGYSASNTTVSTTKNLGNGSSNHFFLLNKCYFNGAIDSKTYVQKLNSISLSANTTSSSNVTVNPTNTAVKYYRINVKAITDMYSDVNEKVAEVQANADKYTNEDDFYAAANAILNFDVNKYDFSVDTDATVAACETEMQSIVDAYNNFELDTVNPQNAANLTLDDTVKFNFNIDSKYYLKNDFAGVDASELEYEVSYVQKSVDVEAPSKTVVETKEVVLDENGKTVISVETAPAQLTEDIQIVLKKIGEENGTKVVNKYSMKDYCDAVINANLKSAPVCKALINYAAAAQTYFNYNVEDLAAIIDEAELNADYNAVAASVNGTASVDDSIETFDVRGVSFLALSDTTIRFYLSVDGRPATNDDLYFGDYEIVNFEMQNQYGSREYDVHFAQTPEGLVYISVSGIESANLDNTFSFDVLGPTGTMEITYCATAFCKSAITNSSNDDLKTLAKTVVLYNVAADKVFVG